MYFLYLDRVFTNLPTHWAVTKKYICLWAFFTLVQSYLFIIINTPQLVIDNPFPFHVCQNDPLNFRKLKIAVFSGLLFLIVMSTVLRSGALKAVIPRHFQCEAYPAHLRQFYAINSGLRKEGISAPQEVSIANTKRLYEIIGSPLDAIPTLHVGGTNGKVIASYLDPCASILKSRAFHFREPHPSSFQRSSKPTAFELDSLWVPT